MILALQSTLTKPLFCEYPPEARDRLLRDAIVIGLRSKEAYYKCIEKGSALTLEEALEIAQNQDATAHQVGYMRPEFKGDPLQMEVHNSKETGSLEPSGTDSSHKDQVPMISPTGQVPVIRNKQNLKEKVDSTVERNRHIPKVSVPQRRQSASSVGRKGITVPFADQRVRMYVLMSYKSSLKQPPRAWTAYWVNTSQFTSTRLFITLRQ